MATITHTEFLARMRRLGNYPNTGNHPQSPISDTFLTDALNDAVGDYCDILDARWAGYRDTTGTITTTANVATKALPTDVRTIRAVDILVGGNYQPLSRIEVGRTYQFQGQAGQPACYMDVAAGLEFFPTPDQAYTIRVRYTPQPPVLAASAGSGVVTSMDVPNRWDRYIVRMALLAVDEQQEKSIQDRMAIIARLELAVTNAAGDRNVAEPEYIPFPGEGHDGWWIIP
jgi:hypothetical protein